MKAFNVSHSEFNVSARVDCSQWGVKSLYKFTAHMSCEVMIVKFWWIWIMGRLKAVGFC